MGSRDKELLKRLLATFRVEAEEHVTAISSGLVELERASSPERQTEIVESVFREAHSLKGAARAVNLAKIEGICQSLESLFAQLKAQERALSPELFDQLHQMGNTLERCFPPRALKPRMSMPPPRFRGRELPVPRILPSPLRQCHQQCSLRRVRVPAHLPFPFAFASPRPLQNPDTLPTRNRDCPRP